MFCQKCGNELKPTDTFCPKCGTTIEKTERSSEVKQESVNNTNNNIGNQQELIAKAKNFIINTRSKKNMLGLIATAIMFIAMILPYAKASAFGFSDSINYIATDDGKIVIILLVITAVTYYLKRDGISCLLSVVMFIITCIDWADIKHATSRLAEASIGCYLMALALIAMILAPFICDKVEKLIKKN